MRRYRADQDRRIEASNFGETITRFIGDLNWQRHSLSANSTKTGFRCRDKKPALNYLEISLHPYWLVRLQRKHSVDQVADGQSVISAGPSAVLPETKPTGFAHRIAASHHAVAVRKFNQATIHVSSRENAAQLALAGLVGPIGRCTGSPAHLLHALQARGSPTILTE